MNDYHGINHMKSYFDNPKLADPSSAKLIRNKVFKRIRAPVIDGNQENEETRDAEADQTFMPALAGDSGDPNPDAPKPDERDRWVSLTQLQYDRLQKWVDGEFTTGNKEDQNPYENVNFDEIPLQDQPSALTRAALEWSVGAPLYPGIEVFWHARQDELYKQAAQNEPWNRFRLADTVTPGDLGKGLALPWQSDFNMCNTHWWPSVRPDLVVAGPNFDSVLGNTQPGDLDKLASNLPPDTRVAWARGIEGEPDSHESNSNMVRKWAELGFVARQYYGPNAQATGNDQYPYGTLGNHRGDVDQNGNPLPEILVERQRNPDAS
ncbi:unnamed protein product [Rhizoctonia solani]|uniref:L-lysine epsilon oxidase C-terminal domain-containing protein n=1 Tax=Rhizoctonia solani TaxID=456999 RepID=A0A8H3E5J9_9AGAM|nr:unnamed protein product [Rhizoctonia solani]